MTVLHEIFDYKRTLLDHYKQMSESISPHVLNGEASFQFSSDSIQIIGEIKRTSPSASVIDDQIDLPTRVKSYEEGGVSMISVLTEDRYFSGSYNDLERVSALTSLPILNKDFIVSGDQIRLARHYGATHILLIATVLSQSELFELYDVAKDLGMEALIEIHSMEDYQKIKGTSVPLVGINNRNLKTMTVDIQTTLRLLPYMDRCHHIVSESGIKTPSDIRTLYREGITTFLIGESLMRQKQPHQLIQKYIGAAHEA